MQCLQSANSDRMKGLEVKNERCHYNGALTKHFGKVHAVDHISLNVRKGEIYGFLGLNGAGKTTTIRMLLGMIRPTEGRVYLNGRHVNAGAYELWKDVGYLVETPNAYPD